ncbi:MAG: carboxypeptidase regulatory-like domain-containing protein [Saprospiraceae bacterium]
MLLKKITILLQILFFTTIALAQDQPTQVIRGTVTDALTGKSLPGASVLLPGTIPIKGTTTNENGQYRLENVPVGRYSLEATFLGYELVSVSEILVESGKELILNIALYEQPESLNEVVVKTKRRESAALSPVSVQSITVEEVLRYPATFNDPARLATSYAGVVNTNDQANHISVRGNSPNSTSWRLEGAEIVNPNHLGDAGTSDGRPSVSGGGVNILSAQLLGTSNFYTGAFPLEFGNAIGGIMDMRFRNGNDERHEFTAQASTVGFDFSAEGPLSKNKKISYLVNYRYSFVGLLTAMGVDFGGEAIAFQDIAFNVNFSLSKNSNLKVFGMAGLSENIFTGELDSTKWEIDKDRYNISFTNRMGAIGASYSNALSEKIGLKITAIGSGVETNKRSDLIGLEGPGLVTEGFYFDSLLHRKIALNANLTYKFNAKHQFQFTTSATDQLYDISSLNVGYTADDRDGGVLLGNSLKWIWSPINDLRFQAGLHQAYFTFTDRSSLEPRASVRWFASSRDKLSFSYGLHSQLQPGQIYFGNNSSNMDLDFTKSHHYVFNYTRYFGASTQVSLEAYYQSIFDVPVNRSAASANAFSTLNTLSNFQNGNFVNQGQGTNYGLELTWNRALKNDYFILANATIYESKFDLLAATRNTRFNGQYLFNLTGGKEFSWSKKGKQKILGINARATYAGGLRRTPIDEIASAETFQATVFTPNNSFALQQDDYFKIDFRIYLKNNKAKYNSTLALDLQNVTNRKNDGFYYYDHQQGRVRAQPQLGLIPNLSYRIEF